MALQQFAAFMFDDTSCVCRYGSVLMSARLGSKVEIITTTHMPASTPPALPWTSYNSCTTRMPAQPPTDTQTPVTSWEVSDAVH